MIRFKVLLKKLSYTSKNESGAALVLVALLMFVIMGFSALIVDAGQMYKTRREMVNAADAAALAGAKAYTEALKEDRFDEAAGDAISQATIYANNNGSQSDLTNVTIKTISYNGETTPRKVIEVKTGNNDKHFFARVIGFDNSNVTASATATWGYIKKIKGGDFLPIYVKDSDFNLSAPFPLHEEKVINDEDDILNGNWGYIALDLGDRSMSDIIDAFSGIPVTNTFWTGTVEGYCAENKQGSGDALKDAVEDRMDKCADGEVTMSGLVPVIEEIIPSGGSKLILVIKEFAVYHIDDIIMKSNKNKNTSTGSAHADFDFGAGSGIEYDQYYPTATILGHFTGETVDVYEVVIDNDQEDPSGVGDPPATYVKLIY